MDKYCNKCQITKPVSEFQKESRAINGFKPRCKDCTNEYYRSKYSDFKEVKLNQLKGYYQENKEAKKEYARRYNIKNKEHKRAYSKEWNEKNKEYVTKYKLNYVKKRRKENPAFRIMAAMRKNLERLKIEKGGSTMKTLGYSLDELILKLGRLPECTESIDHKVPMSWFELNAAANLIHHPDNLHIITMSENSKKGSRWSHPITKKYFKLIKPFIKIEKVHLINLIS